MFYLHFGLHLETISRRFRVTTLVCRAKYLIRLLARDREPMSNVPVFSKTRMLNTSSLSSYQEVATSLIIPNYPLLLYFIVSPNHEYTLW